jgi:AcrR family transcriptional regulator
MARQTSRKKTCPRPYRLGKRQETMDQTRAKIITAARTLILSENALEGFNIDAIARRTGITRMTIYNQFGGRIGLLEALFDDLAQRGEMYRMPKVFQKQNPIEALKAFIAAFGRFWTTDRAIIRRLRAMAALDAELAEADAARQERRRQGANVIIKRLNEKHSLTSTRPLKQCVEILFTMTSFEFFDTLAGESHTPEEVVPLVQNSVMKILEINAEP